MRRVWIATAALSLSLAMAAPSLAARAEMSQAANKYFARWSVLWVTGAAGEHNDILVTESADGIRVTDSTPVRTGGFCEAQADGSALCRAAPDAPLTTVRIDAGDLDDSARAELETASSAYLWGGPGDDVLTMVAASHRAPSAQFNGGPGDDQMIGGIETDHFIEGSESNGSDLMVGGGEPKISLDFFNRGDEVSYARRVNPVHADLEGDRDDGERSERDRIGSDVETIVGGRGADVLGGNATANFLDGAHGADLLTAGDGDDLVRGGPNADRSADRLRGGRGADYLYGGGGGDSLYAGPGPDEVRGGPGRDELWPEAGEDKIFGGPGNDMLWTLDRATEWIVCGGGADRVLPDRLDVLADDCERDLSRPRRVRR